ncbi:MAG: LuxR C-terminal-related transcriptional regulator [Prosthecobacter sp.]|uniref:LuxR C-terminal-related transcriptional regulator n=1 Tax=Prosthecobacter sp. TaxID=1965333 RepID=UPI0039024D56
MAAWLEQQGTKQVIESEIFLGRHKDNDLCLPHEGVSRRHALVYPQGGAYFVSDLGSTNGVLLNGIRLRLPTELNDKDELMIGPARLLFRWPGQRVARQAQDESGPTERTALVAPSLGGFSRIVLRVDQQLKVHAPDVTWAGLMKRFFREPVDPYTATPPRLHQWLRATTTALSRTPHALAEPFVAEQSGSKLVVRCLPSPPHEWFLLCTVETPIFESSALQALGLSDREADVMKWIAEGKTNADIGTILAISTSTVNKHVESILKKLGVENRSQAIREVIERIGRG